MLCSVTLQYGVYCMPCLSLLHRWAPLPGPCLCALPIGCAFPAAESSAALLHSGEQRQAAALSRGLAGWMRAVKDWRAVEASRSSCLRMALRSGSSSCCDDGDNAIHYTTWDRVARAGAAGGEQGA
ncbi:hypothetical protein K431DRAFT_59266 [Polychaeton citri CBS 116435]|uniref:Uncharacterized protein n=1 Tax=Polychaeton citri CBS 116435 TaxID=1314669 RepID=A0A9P4UN73_9PEZI|nr:hypothetical protein K431DRAFT_59266 [Polychaeton citri CBS 116435]